MLWQVNRYKSIIITYIQITSWKMAATRITTMGIKAYVNKYNLTNVYNIYIIKNNLWMK